MSPQDQLNRLRREMDELNREMLDLLSRRGTLAVEIGKVKRLQGVERYDPVREREMLDFIAASNPGPFETARLQHLFKEMFKASAELQEMIQDISSITQVSGDFDQEDEESETAFVVLYEHLKLGATLAFEEFGKGQAQPQRPTLH